MELSSGIGVRVPSEHLPGHPVYSREGKCREDWAARVTVKNLEIVEVQKEKDLLLVKGAVPGFSGGYVFIKNPRK